MISFCIFNPNFNLRFLLIIQYSWSGLPSRFMTLNGIVISRSTKVGNACWRPRLFVGCEWHSISIHFNPRFDLHFMNLVLYPQQFLLVSSLYLCICLLKVKELFWYHHAFINNLRLFFINLLKLSCLIVLVLIISIRGISSSYWHLWLVEGIRISINWCNLILVSFCLSGFNIIARSDLFIRYFYVILS